MSSGEIFFAMPTQAQLMAGWAAFAFLMGCCGYLALAACDLGIRPLFALKYCSVPASPDRLADQRARETDLRDRIHQAEMHLARLPVCAAPSPSPLPPEPKKEARVVPPTPTPTPSPTPTPTPQPSPTATPEPPEQLKIPKNLFELKGCWQSVRGDIEIIDQEQNPAGAVRVCYCFGNNGRGSVKAVYTDGVKCRASLQARIYSDRLVMKHQGLTCSASDHNIRAGELECKGTEGDAATCDWSTWGSHGGNDENYQRVPPERCN
jgi:hypothetical protein